MSSRIILAKFIPNDLVNIIEKYLSPDWAGVQELIDTHKNSLYNLPLHLFDDKLGMPIMQSISCLLNPHTLTIPYDITTDLAITSDGRESLQLWTLLNNIESLNVECMNFQGTKDITSTDKNVYTSYHNSEELCFTSYISKLMKYIWSRTSTIVYQKRISHTRWTKEEYGYVLRVCKMIKGF